MFVFEHKIAATNFRKAIAWSLAPKGDTQPTHPDACPEPIQIFKLSRAMVIERTTMNENLALNICENVKLRTSVEIQFNCRVAQTAYMTSPTTTHPYKTWFQKLQNCPETGLCRYGMFYIWILTKRWCCCCCTNVLRIAHKEKVPIGMAKSDFWKVSLGMCDCVYVWIMVIAYWILCWCWLGLRT